MVTLSSLGVMVVPIMQVPQMAGGDTEDIITRAGGHRRCHCSRQTMLGLGERFVIFG